MVAFPLGLNGKIVELLNRFGAGVEADVVFELPDFGCARGQDQVLSAHGVHDVGRRKTLGLQESGLEIDHHLPLLSAVGPGDGRTLHGGKLSANAIGGIVEKLLLRKPSFQIAPIA